MSLLGYLRRLMGIFPPPENDEHRIYDRVFILIGNTKTGKSILGNLLLGETTFTVRERTISCSTTKLVQSADTTLSPGTVMGMNFRGDNVLRIKVIDQPGMDDGNFKIRHHCENLIKCMSEVHVRTFPTFLIVIDLTLNMLSADRVLLLSQLSESLIQASYGLYSHAVVVFTHIDQLGCDINNIDTLKQIVKQKCQQEYWEELAEILEAVNNRCIFVNGTNTEPLYRSQILRDLFVVSKSTLHIRFHGNNYFTSEFLRNKLGVHGNRIEEEELYKLNYQFQPDLNIFWRDVERDMDLNDQIGKAIHSIVALGEGVSAVVILVSLLKSMSTQMEELIYSLPKCYIQEDDPEFDLRQEEWWKHVFFIFEVSDEAGGRESVVENLVANSILRTMVCRGSRKWTWIAKETSISTCRARITEMCLEVRREIGGKVFIHSVIEEIKKMKNDLDNYSGNNTQVAGYDQAFHQKMAEGVINFIQSDNKIIMKVGGIVLKNKISIRSMRMILRNTKLNKCEMDRFKERYKDPKAYVPIEEILNFIANP